MKLRVERKWKKDSYTIGNLYVDGQFLCNTLEDKDRGLTQEMSEAEISRIKKYGITAIPRGTYRIDMSIVSNKFKDRSWAKPFYGKLPRLVGVKGYIGVLIHVGNKAEDTDGCILVGKNTKVGRVTDSSKWFSVLMNNYLIPAYARGEEITITID